MLKRILVLLLPLIITGCTANYNLTIEKNAFKESVDIIFSKKSFPLKGIESVMAKKIPIRQDKYENRFYENKLKENEENYIINQTFSHGSETIADSSLITRCYVGDVINITSDRIKIKTNNQFQCIYMDDGAQMDSATINITTPLKVLNNNADRINGNTYIWNINKENYQNKPILFEVSTKNFNVKTDSFQIKLAISVIVIIVIGAIIYLITKMKRNKNNKL